MTIFTFTLTDDNGNVLFDKAFRSYEAGENNLKAFMMYTWDYTHEEADTDFNELIYLPTNQNGETLEVKRYEMREK